MLYIVICYYYIGKTNHMPVTWCPTGVRHVLKSSQETREMILLCARPRPPLVPSCWHDYGKWRKRNLGVWRVSRRVFTSDFQLPPYVAVIKFVEETRRNAQIMLMDNIRKNSSSLSFYHLFLAFLDGGESHYCLPCLSMCGVSKVVLHKFRLSVYDNDSW